MSDIRVFRYRDDTAEELASRSAQLERAIHGLVEQHMETFLGVHFIAHEYSTGRNHRGRIDSLGLDENNCPVIIEYKRFGNESVINQGLFYLDWLLDHKADFKLLVLDGMDKKTADDIEWAGTRVLCIANDFTRYDEHAVAQIGRDIELIRYKYFADDLLMLEWVNPVRSEAGSSRKDTTSIEDISSESNRQRKYTTAADSLVKLPSSLRAVYDTIVAFAGSLGDDINIKELKHYIAFSRLKNFTCLRPMHDHLKVWLKLDPATVKMEEGFSRDVTDIGHWGTGNVEVILNDNSGFEKMKPLVERAYLEN